MPCSEKRLIAPIELLDAELVNDNLNVWDQAWEAEKLRFFLHVLLIATCVSALQFFHSKQLFAQISQIDAHYVSLAGEARYKSSRSLDLDFVKDDFDDSDWQPVTLPGKIKQFGGSPWDQIGLLRIRFQVPKNFAAEDVAFVGYLEKQFEVYLNGKKIGGVQHFGDNVKSMRWDGNVGRFSAFEVPNGLLRRDAENLLAIRYSHLLLIHNDGVGDGLFGLSDLKTALLAKADIERVQATTEALVFGINSAFASLALGAILFFRVRDRALFWFTALIINLLFVDALSSPWLVQEGYQTWLTTTLFVVLVPLGIISNVFFVAALLNLRTGRAGIVFSSLAVLTFSAYFLHALLPIHLAQFWNMFCSLLFILVWLISFAWVPIGAIWAIGRGNSVGWQVLIAYTVFVTAPFVWELLDPAQFTKMTLVFGDSPSWFTKQLFLLSLSIILGQRLFAIEQARISANLRALDAQASERKRLARDIHDGVAQGLASIKLRLQLLAGQRQASGRKSPDKLGILIGDVSALIDDTRRISHDLSPVLLSQKGLSAALEGFVQRLTHDHGVAVALKVEATRDLSENIAEHLYRIIQEASYNAVSHGKAAHLRIELKQTKGRKTKLEIWDDGVGFDTEKETRRTQRGLGLQSIQERTIMMEGTYAIKSKPMSGTTLTIEV